MGFLMGLLGLVLIASWALTGLLRRYALARELLDVPNVRSSHAVPTPRGGGLAIVVTVLLALPLLWWHGTLSAMESLGLFGSGVLVALIGWLDDHGHVAARWRLLVHFLAVGWGMACLGGMPDLSFFGWILSGWWLWIPVLFFLVWLLNLYNFMDGIDGIAGIEATTVCLSGALLLLLVAPGGFGWVLPVLLAAAVLGFLIWNYPPARIFMGDAGSGFVGIFLGLLIVAAAQVEPVLFWAWLVLLGTFVVDATVTLLRRVLKGETFYEAHRSHAYQYLARKWNSHQKVSLLYGAVNLFWLLPVAWLVVNTKLEGAVGLLIAYAPLVGLAWWCKAGDSKSQELVEG